MAERHFITNKLNGGLPGTKDYAENVPDPIKKVCRECWNHVKVYNVSSIWMDASGF